MPHKAQDQPQAQATTKVGEAAQIVKFGPVSWRIKAKDNTAAGASFASAPFQSEADARQFAADLKAFWPGRFSLIRLECSREAMLGGKDE